MAASCSCFPFRNTMYNIRSNRQAQGTGHGPPGEDPPLSAEPQRAEWPLPSDPGTPGERSGLGCPQRPSECPLCPPPKSAFMLFVLNMKLSRSLLLVSVGLVAMTPFFINIIVVKYT